MHLEGQGDLASRSIMGIIRVTIWVIGLLTYLLSPRDSPSRSIGIGVLRYVIRKI